MLLKRRGDTVLNVTERLGCATGITDVHLDIDLFVTQSPARGGYIPVGAGGDLGDTLHRAG